MQEEKEQIIFVQTKVHQFKFVDMNKMVPTDPLWLVAFFEQCQTAAKASDVLDKLKEKKQQKKKKTAHLPVTHNCDSNHWHHHHNNHN